MVVVGEGIISLFFKPIEKGFKMSLEPGIYNRLVSDSEKAMALHSSTLAWKIPWMEATVHGVAKSRTQLSDFTFTFHFHALAR